MYVTTDKHRLLMLVNFPLFANRPIAVYIGRHRCWPIHQCIPTLNTQGILVRGWSIYSYPSVGCMRSSVESICLFHQHDSYWKMSHNCVVTDSWIVVVIFVCPNFWPFCGDICYVYLLGKGFHDLLLRLTVSSRRWTLHKTCAVLQAFHLKGSGTFRNWIMPQAETSWSANAELL